MLSKINLMKKNRLFFFNHHCWPDGSPAAIYVEQLADEIVKANAGLEIFIISTSSTFRPSSRTKPRTDTVILRTKTYGRNSVLSMLLDYINTYKVFSSYIKKNINKFDSVVVTSSPFLNLFLIRPLSTVGVKKSLYWLHDYFPDSLLSMGLIYLPFYPFFEFVWKNLLKKWAVVIKPASNFDYGGNNSVLFRFWPTISLPSVRYKTKKSVLYIGNLGVTHDSRSVISKASDYYRSGYTINFYVDGPKALKLPSWINVKKFKTEEQMMKILDEHPIHLTAGTVRSDKGSFPTKTWNSLILGKEIIPCGFGKAMMNELKMIRSLPFNNNKHDLAEFLIKFSKP